MHICIVQYLPILYVILYVHANISILPITRNNELLPDCIAPDSGERKRGVGRFVARCVRARKLYLFAGLCVHRRIDTAVRRVPAGHDQLRNVERHHLLLRS